MHINQRVRLALTGVLVMVCVGWADPPAEQSAPTDDAATIAETGEEPAIESSPELAFGSGDDDFNPYADMDLAQLMQIQVTSVAGVKEDWFATPSALYVITSEDIRRSGCQLLPEVFRLAPGVTVQRFDARQWGVGIRGFNTLLVNKLLVRIDGRSVYDAAFAGTFWDVQDVLMEDLDRIEVVRGPGATLWGSNAVNGVINITTKSARQTQGTYVTGIYGTDLQPLVAARYGGQLGESTWFRIWGKYTQHDSFDRLFMREDRPDDWDMARGGLRLDHQWGEHTTLTLDIGGYQTDRLGEGTTVPVAGPVPLSTDEVEDIRDGRASGLHVLGNIEHEDTVEGWGWSLKAFYDRTNRSIFAGVGVDRDTFEIDLRHHRQWGADDEHETLWGVGYRYTADRTEDGRFIVMRPRDRAKPLYSAFVQHTWDIIPTVHLMVGTKFEHNDHTGVEWQPSTRVWWTPNDRHTLWAAVSRPIRTPSRTEDDVILTLVRGNGGPGVTIDVNVVGDPSVEVERLLAYEGGYRVRPFDNLTIDAAVFFNEYDDVLDFIPPTTAAGTVYSNATGAQTYGTEIAVTCRPADNWRLRGSYSFVRMDIKRQNVSLGRETPENQFRISSAYDVTDDLEFNASLHAYEKAPDSSNGSFVRLDLGATWRPDDHLELSVWGQNLLDDEHAEQSDPILISSRVDVPRSVHVQATWRF